MPGWSGAARRFREMLGSGRPYVQPGVFNAQSALIAQAAGFQTVGLSGYSLSATMLGKPDVGLTTMTEVVQMTGYVFAFVVVMALFLFLTDKTLEWVLYDLILGWKR